MKETIKNLSIFSTILFTGCTPNESKLQPVTTPAPEFSIADNNCDKIKNLRIDYRTKSKPDKLQTLCIEKHKSDSDGNSTNLPANTIEAELTTIIPKGEYKNTWAVGVNRTELNPEINLNSEPVKPNKVDGAMIRYNIKADLPRNNVKLRLPFNSESEDKSKIGIWFGK